MDAERLDDWFLTQVMPLEPALMRFLRRNWRDETEIADLRQDLYVRLYEAGRDGLPAHTRPFVFTAARNLLINRARRARIISIEVVADLEALNLEADSITPERHATARDELRRLQAGLDRLPPRCREVVVMRRIDGLSQREVAARMGVGEDTVEKQMLYGMRALIDFMLGGSGKQRRRAAETGGKQLKRP